MEEPVSRLGQRAEQMGPVEREPAKPTRASRITAIALLLAASASIAALLTPSHRHHDFSEFRVGRPAPYRVVADRTYSIEDIETTRRKRAEAFDSVRTVYDYETELTSSAEERLRSAFAAARMHLEVDHAEIPDPAKLPSRAGHAATATPYAVPRPTDARSLDERKRDASEELARNLRLLVTPEEDKALRETNYAVETENALVELVTTALSAYLVRDRVQLSPEVGRGITVRVLRTGKVVEEQVVSDITNIKDIDEAVRWVREQADSAYPEFPKPRREAIAALAARLVQPNLTINTLETQARREAAAEGVKPVIQLVERGELIIQKGVRADQQTLLSLASMQRSEDATNWYSVFIGAFLLSLVVLSSAHLFGARNIKKYRPTARELGFLAFTLVATLAISKLWSGGAALVNEWQADVPPSAVQYAVPVAIGAMLVRFMLNSETALVFTLPLALLFGLMFDQSLTMSAFAAVTSVVAAHGVRHVKSRSQITQASLITGVAGMATVGCLALIGGDEHQATILWDLGGAFAGGVFTALIVGTVANLVEDLFGFTTDIKLLEYSNMNHPLLKELLLKAPGTYHHSILVGTLAEAGAEVIGANPLLARIASYYHDIGKTKKPDYFGENQRGFNPHEKCTPNMSAAIIKSHVTIGVELARQYKLGKPIIDVIEQHHGTTLITYFYQKARDEADEDEAVSETQFRYDGPKPQFRESALIMIADHCEAAAKSLADPSEDRIRGLVQKLINKLFADGQFDECELTLKDLHLIARAYITLLTSYYAATRPAYPTSPTKQRDVIEFGRALQREPIAAGMGKVRRLEAPGLRNVARPTSMPFTGSQIMGDGPAQPSANLASMTVPQAVNADESHVDRAAAADTDILAGGETKSGEAASRK